MANFRRKVFYLSGFDPRGARFYHGLMAEQLASTGLHLGARQRLGTNSRWAVAADGGALRADITFLGWDDLVRAHWPRGVWSLLGHVALAYGRYGCWLDWRLVGQWPCGTRITVFSPGVCLLLLPPAVAAAAYGALLRLLPWGAALAAALALAGLACGYLLRHLRSLWVARFMVFNDQFARRTTGPALDQRLGQFACDIAAELNADWDEVLLITHSNGSTLSVPIMAQLLALYKGRLPAHFALVTLGSCTQLLAARRDAAWFAQLLDRLGAGGFAWLDLGSPTDGACAPLVPPCQGRKVARPPGLVQKSPRWFRYCDQAAYQARRRDKYSTHFEYLRRLDHASPLDFIGLTCAARPLAQSIAEFEVAHGPA